MQCFTATEMEIVVRLKHLEKTSTFQEDATPCRAKCQKMGKYERTCHYKEFHNFSVMRVEDTCLSSHEFSTIQLVDFIYVEVVSNLGLDG